MNEAARMIDAGSAHEQQGHTVHWLGHTAIDTNPRKMDSAMQHIWLQQQHPNCSFSRLSSE
jgi:hypothetical protein